MKYPMLSNRLTFTLRDDGIYQVQDYLNEDRYTLPASVVDFAQQLDGRHDPYRIVPGQPRTETDRMLRQLDDYDMLRHRRFQSGGGLFLFTLWFVKPGTRLGRIARVWTRALNLLWIPMMAAGLWIFLHGNVTGAEAYVPAGGIAGLLIGLLLHEMGHLMAALAWGGRVSEMGLLLMYFMPGAYVLAEQMKSRKARIQMKAAGVKTNFLLGGLFLILSCVLSKAGFPMLQAAYINFFMGFVNLVFIRGLDGNSLIEEYMGLGGLTEAGKQLLFSRKYRKEVLPAGPSGCAITAAAGMIQALQLSLPLLFLLYILEVFL